MAFARPSPGLLSFGAIARGIAERARPFGVDVWAHDPFVDEADLRQSSVRPVSFDDLVAGSDYLIIQAPLTSETHHPIDDVISWHLDRTALNEIDDIIRETVHDPVGPEFMAPPERQPA